MDLKKIRKEKGMTQFEVAKAVGVSGTSYIAWEKGAMNPSPENMIKLKKVLEIKE